MFPSQLKSLLESTKHSDGKGCQWVDLNDMTSKKQELTFRSNNVTPSTVLAVSMNASTLDIKVTIAGTCRSLINIVLKSVTYQLGAWSMSVVTVMPSSIVVRYYDQDASRCIATANHLNDLKTTNDKNQGFLWRCVSTWQTVEVILLLWFWTYQTYWWYSGISFGGKKIDIIF